MSQCWERIVTEFILILVSVAALVGWWVAFLYAKQARRWRESWAADRKSQDARP